jgi:hypothetical protein
MILRWTLALGGIASLDGISSHKWNVEEISQHRIRRDLSLATVVLDLRRFLYWNHIMAESVATLWTEVIQCQEQLPGWNEHHELSSAAVMIDRIRSWDLLTASFNVSCAILFRQGAYFG